MKAIIVALDRSVEKEFQRLALPFLLPLVDRPFLQHVVERLIDAGITEFEMVTDSRTRQISDLFGTGQRWGCAMRYHEVADSRSTLPTLRTLTKAQLDEPVLVMTADALPDFKSADLLRLMEEPHRLSYSCPESTAARAWSGWAVVDGCFLASLPPKGSIDTVTKCLQQSGEIGVRSNLIHAGTYAELLEAQKHVNEDYTARNARVHPTATIVGPVFIGENARIERGAQLGPNVVVGAGCVVGVNTRIKNSLICPNTYVGDGLEIDRLILDGVELFHAALSASVTVREPMFLSRLSR